jgi:hypothetical protein
VHANLECCAATEANAQTDCLHTPFQHPVTDYVPNRQKLFREQRQTHDIMKGGTPCASRARVAHTLAASAYPIPCFCRPCMRRCPVTYAALMEASG